MIEGRDEGRAKAVKGMEKHLKKNSTTTVTGNITLILDSNMELQSGIAWFSLVTRAGDYL